MLPRLYRVFLTPLTVFLLCAAFFTPPPAFSQDNEIYQISGVSVDVNGTSALDARNKAFAEARRKAYEQLADRLLSPSDRPGLVVPDDRVLSSLVRDLQITSEKMTSRRYAGTMNVRFTPAAVKRTMQVSNAPLMPQDNMPIADADIEAPQAPVDVAADAAVTGEDYIYSPNRGAAVRVAGTTSVPPGKTTAPAARRILVLPWYGPLGRQSLWAPGNPWRDAWESNSALRDPGTPIILPSGSADDLRDYAPPQPLSRRGDIASLLTRYRASEAVLAMAEPYPEGGVTVSLYRYESGAPVALGRFGVDAGEQTLSEAVVKSAASLRALPAVAAPAPMSVSMRSPIPSAAQPGGPYRMLAKFSGLQQWVSIRNTLARLPGIGVIDIRSISPSQAQIEFTYAGDQNALASALAQNNLQLTAVTGGLASAVPGAMPPQYMLTQARSY